MKIRLISALFIILIHFSIQLLEEDITTYSLISEMKRVPYLIYSNRAYKFVNSNEKLIYFLEVQDDIEMLDINNNTFKYLISLSHLNDASIINPKDEIGSEIQVFVSSISNNEVDAVQLKSLYFQSSNNIRKSLINVIHTKEDQEQIVNLNSNENSVLFYYWQYEFKDDFNPQDYYPINRKVLTKYDNSILTLNKDSVYIIIADIYKLDIPINTIDIFISPLQADKNINNSEYNFLYLKESEAPYNITFQDSDLTRVLKLSKKTNNSLITLDGTTILNSENRYYELMSNTFQLKVEKSDCLIEILFLSKNNSDILDYNTIENYKLTKTFTIIKIPNKKCIYSCYLKSKNKNNLKIFNFGFINKISKNDYFYNWININFNYNNDGLDLFLDLPYLYRSNIDDDEYQIFEIVLDKEQLDNDIYLDYNPIRDFKYLLKEIDETKAEYIIGNISSILNKFYIYKDIAKKPPQIENLDNYHHKPIDLLGDLNSISTKNRTYFSLYQDIKQVLGSIRDDHLSIRIKDVENFKDVSLCGFCSPFKFYINIKEGDEVVKIKSNDFCLNLFTNKNKILKFIEDHANIELKYINGTDPFDFIQNFGKYQRFKNKHAQFTINLDSVSSSRFDIEPYDVSDISNIIYEFANGDIINLNYKVITYYSFKDIDQNEFKEFFLSFNYNQSNPLLSPDLLETKKLFMKKKGFLLDETPNKIEWDLQTKDGYLKCKVDTENKYNVFLQTSFSFSDFDDVIDVMVNCSELFYSNNYKIIGIENKNGGGTSDLYEIWHQLIQQKTLDKTYRALIRNNRSFEFFKDNNFFTTYSNIETCKFFGSFEEMGELSDNFGYSEKFQEQIIHNRSKIYDFLDKTWKKRLYKIRKRNFDKNNLKNPTDIIIYTDSYCFSTCSGFVKAFQNTGGAIIVGFNGNPKIKGTYEFDGSQSSSSVSDFKSEEYYALENLGYHVYGVTYSESYDDSYQNKNKAPIPREYTVDLVDKRVPIYEEYSDELYPSFISHAKSIFDEFKDKCNKNNKKLILDDETCTFEGNEKGGHPCNDEGIWDRKNCSAYYCDLGYYFDQYQQKCIPDICTNIPNETNIHINDTTYLETKEFTINPDAEMVFNLENDNYYYFFQSNLSNIFSTYYDDEQMVNRTNLCVVDYLHQNIFNYEVNVNYYKTIKEPTTIKLTMIKKNPKIYFGDNHYSNKISIDSFSTINGEYQKIYNLQSPNKFIIFASSFDKNMKAYYFEYNYEITPQEIIDINSKKFNEFENKIVSTKENKTYIVILKYPKDIVSSSILFIRTNNIGQELSISNERFFYLSKQNFDYNFYNPYSKNIYMRLSRQSPDAEIEILDKNFIMNKNNRYFLFKHDTSKISLRLKNDNLALIEFLYQLYDTKVLDSSKKEFILSNGEYYILKYKKSDKIESIKINLESNNAFTIAIYADIGKDNYIGPIPGGLKYESKVSSEFLVPNDQLAVDETFNILFVTKDNVTLHVELKMDEKTDPEPKPEPEPESDKKSFPTWAIIVIVIGGVMILAVIILIIIIRLKKDNVSADTIEKGNLLSVDNE